MPLTEADLKDVPKRLAYLNQQEADLVALKTQVADLLPLKTQVVQMGQELATLKAEKQSISKPHDLCYDRGCPQCAVTKEYIEQGRVAGHGAGYDEAMDDVALAAQELGDQPLVGTPTDMLEAIAVKMGQRRGKMTAA